MNFKSIVLGAFALLLGTMAMQAQEPRQCTPPDYEKIKIQVSENPSAYYDMLDRFMAADSTLTSEDVYTLYYGYPFSGKYDPFFTLEDLEKAIDEDFIPKAEDMYAKATKNQQMSLGALYYLYIIHRKAKDAADRAKSEDDLWRISMVMDVITASGNGDQETPMYVIFALDEYAVLGLMEYPTPTNQKMQGYCDVLTVDVESSDGLGLFTEPTDIYFNIAPSLDFTPSDK